MNATEPTAHERVLEELARSRGLDGIEELRKRLWAAGHRKTSKLLVEESPGGFGQDLDEILDLTEEEKASITDAFTETFLRRSARRS